MMLHKLLIGAMAAALLAGPASATDFTFDVPVEVHDVPLLSQIAVDCLVSVLPVATTGAAAESNIVGRGTVTVDAPGGNYQGTVSVPVENRGVLRSIDARSYQCVMRGLGHSASGADITLGNWSYDIQRMTGTGLVSQTLRTEANLP
jgi:hypothetical protein